jgi:hypothetical protein
MLPCSPSGFNELYLYGKMLLSLADSVSVPIYPEIYPEGPRMTTALNTVLILCYWLELGYLSLSREPMLCSRTGF